jgi:glycosyltransferase involved in cell wall biosynthesis
VIKKPLVSIITPSFNRIKYLEACLQSVLSQSYPYVEHVIIDGASTDGTVELLTRYQAMYPGRIRFISEPDESTEEAINKGFAMAKGEIFGWLGSDDIFEPGALKTVAEFFTANPDAYFVFGDCNYIDEKGEISGRYETKDFDLDDLINDSCHIPCPSAFYRREVVEKVGGFDATIKGSDVEYWMRIGKVFLIHRIKKTLSSYRQHLDKRGAAVMEAKLRAREDFLISRRYGGRRFSPRARRYYLLIITDTIRTVLLPVYYHFLKNVVDLLRPVFGFSYPFFMRALDKLTIKR